MSRALTILWTTLLMALVLGVIGYTIWPSEALRRASLTLWAAVIVVGAAEWYLTRKDAR